MWSKPLLEPEGLQATWLPLAFVSHNLNPHGSSLSLGLLSEAGRQAAGVPGRPNGLQSHSPGCTHLLYSSLLEWLQLTFSTKPVLLHSATVFCKQGPRINSQRTPQFHIQNSIICLCPPCLFIYVPSASAWKAPVQALLINQLLKRGLKCLVSSPSFEGQVHIPGVAMPDVTNHMCLLNYTDKNSCALILSKH